MARAIALQLGHDGGMALRFTDRASMVPQRKRNIIVNRHIVQQPRLLENRPDAEAHRGPIHAG
jgi:hypothetical protein